jgi:mono/diheme cytochrome c family protein
MRVIPNTVKNALGVIILMSLAGLASADPRIISTYKARNVEVQDPGDGGGSDGSQVSTGNHGSNGGKSGTGNTGSSGSKGTTGGTGSTGSNGGSGSSGGSGSKGTTGGTGSSASATAYTIPANFNFNCNTRNPNGDAIENGRRAYVRLNCTVCHSDNGHGGTMGPNIAGAEAGDVSEAVTQGEEGGMPSFKKYLCPNDVADLQAYISSMNSKAAPGFTDWWVAHPPAAFVDSAP